MNMEIKLIDVVAYVFIIGFLIFFVIQIQERNRLLLLNAQLRLKNCNVPGESFNNIIDEFLEDNYSVIDGVGDDLSTVVNGQGSGLESDELVNGFNFSQLIGGR